MSGPGLWGAGFVGPDGTDYVAEQADALRSRMGRGLYSQDPHGAMGQWRDLVAIPLALLRNFLDWMVYNANPGKAIDLLPYWEKTLGLRSGADALSIALRQERCKWKLRRWVSKSTDTPADTERAIASAGFPTEWNLGRIFWNLHHMALGVGYVGFVPTPGEPRYTLTVDARLATPAYSWWLGEIEHWRDRLCPAWGEIIITT